MARIDDVADIETSFGWRSDEMTKIGELVTAVGTEPGYLGDGLDPPVGTAALDEDDHIDRLCDEAPWHAGDGFLDELLNESEEDEEEQAPFAVH
mgnify:CR=1 FL=1